MLESLLTLKIMIEENKECLREREKDGQKTTLTSLEDSQKKNKCIETTSKLILKMIQKMIMLMKC
jgi:hypothetical protein